MMVQLKKQNLLRAFGSELKSICPFWTSCMLSLGSVYVQVYAKLSHKFGFFFKLCFASRCQTADSLVPQYPNDLQKN